MQLRSDGLTYEQIAERLGCSKSTVCYHCGQEQRVKTSARTKRRRESNPGLQAVERFFQRKSTSLGRRIKDKPSKKDVREKVRAFQRRQGSKLVSCKHMSATFTYYEMLAAYPDNARCYLTGRPVDLMNSSTYSLDHVVPATRGGTNDLSNMGIACPQANWAKSDMMVKEFVALCRDVVTHFGLKVTGELGEMAESGLMHSVGNGETLKQ